MAKFRDIAHAYHDFVERRLRCHKAQRAFHLIHGGAHATYFGGVATHHFAFYGPVAAALFFLTALQLFVFNGE